jgi:single-strand DNA-binding protein
MANLNKVMLIGRLTRDPEARSFTNGGKVTAFGFAVTNRKKNQQTGQWEDDPMFIDAKVFNRGETGTLATRAEETLRKGQQIFIEGHLVLEQWEDKNGGGKRSKHVLVVDNFLYLEPRQDGGEAGRPAYRSAPAAARSNGPSRGGAPGHDDEYEEPTGGRSGGGDEDIPF